MPVLRQLERITQPTAQPSGGVVQAGNPMAGANLAPIRTQPATQMAAVLQHQASRWAQQAAEFAKAMGAGAEKTATDLAKAAVISMDKNGTPQLPPDPTAHMGLIAQQTYDASMQDRYAHQMQTSIRAQIDEAHQANLYDAAGFSVDATKRLAKMGETVPKQYQGLFTDMAKSQMASTGAQIGYRTAQVQIADAKSRIKPMVEDGIASVVYSISTGDQPGAEVKMQHLLDTIDAKPDYMMNEGQKEAARSNVYFQVGRARMTSDLHLDLASPDALAQVQHDLVTGKNAELNKYFTRPGTDMPDPKMLSQAANYVGQLHSMAIQKASAAHKAFQHTQDVSWVMNGNAPDTAKNRGILDEQIGHLIQNDNGTQGLRTPDGAERPIQPQDWLYFSPDQRASAMAQVKKSGMVPSSLKGMFLSLERGNDPAALAEGYSLWKDLKDQPAPGGGDTVDMTGQLGADRLTVIYSLASTMAGDGMPGTEQIAQAVHMADAISGPGAKEWTNQTYAAKMGQYQTWTNAWLHGSINPDNVHAKVDTLLADQVFQGQNVSDQLKHDASTLFETYIRLGDAPQTAVDRVKQNMQHRAPPTRYMGPITRSSYAPEKWYPAPEVKTWAQWDKNWPTLMKDAGVDLNKPEYGIFKKVMGGDYGPIAALTATPFDLLADSGIRQMLKSSNVADMGFDTGIGLMTPGSDYVLSYAGAGSDGRPTYHVSMIAANGAHYPLPGTLDVGPQYDKLVAGINKIDAANAMDQRDAGAAQRAMMTGQTGTFGRFQIYKGSRGGMKMREIKK